MAQLDVTMTCECGAGLRFSHDESRVECDCGAIYAVTITQISPPDGT